MADEHHHKSSEYETTENVESTDRGLFDFLGKKEEEKPQEEVIVTEFEKIQVCEPVHVAEPELEVKKEEKVEEEEEKKPSLIEKLHRSHSSSSSSSSDEEEVEEGGEKKKKKKPLKEKIKEKISGEKEEEKKVECEDTTVPIEKYDDIVHSDVTPPEEKKGFLEKIKEKLPGHKKTEEVTPVVAAPTECVPEEPVHEGEPKEKKGIFEKIKEKLPGYHKNGEDKEKEKESSPY